MDRLTLKDLLLIKRCVSWVKEDTGTTDVSSELGHEKECENVLKKIEQYIELQKENECEHPDIEVVWRVVSDGWEEQITCFSTRQVAEEYCKQNPAHTCYKAFAIYGDTEELYGTYEEALDNL